MKAEIKGKKLFIELDINPHPSRSGKTTVIASTSGNQPTTAEYDGQKVTVGANAYIKK